MKKFNLKLSPLLLTLIFQGCMPDSLTKFSKDEAKKAAATTTVVTTPSPTAPPDLTTLKTFQLKNVTGNSTSYHLHKYGAGNTSTACEIPIASLADGQTTLTDESNDILCWLEADETQLFFNGSDFQINAPASQCEYIQVKPYYFWNAPPMNTKKTVKTVACADPTTATCLALGGVSSPDLTCAGDYSKVSGPNCDEGYIINNSYSVPADAVAPAVTPPTSMVSTTIACGGTRTKCFAGPGVDFKVNKGGYPIPVDYLAYNGQSISYSVSAPGPLGKGFGSNHYISNFTKIYSTGLNSYDYTTIASATGMERYSDTSKTTSTATQVDIGSDPLKRADATLYRTGTSSWVTLASPMTYPVQAFYEFSCLNYAHEVKGRIRLQIREWNQQFQTPVANYTEVSESAPTRLLKQSINSTDYETSGVGYWNDVSSWDIPYSYGSSAAYVPAAPITVNSSGFLFPYLGF